MSREDRDPMPAALTPLEPQSRFGDKPLKFQVFCPQNGTGALKGLIGDCFDWLLLEMPLLLLQYVLLLINTATINTTATYC